MRSLIDVAVFRGMLLYPHITAGRSFLNTTIQLPQPTPQFDAFLHENRACIRSLAVAVHFAAFLIDIASFK